MDYVYLDCLVEELPGKKGYHYKLSRLVAPLQFVLPPPVSPVETDDSTTSTTAVAIVAAAGTTATTTTLQLHSTLYLLHLEL